MLPFEMKTVASRFAVARRAFGDIVGGGASAIGRRRTHSLVTVASVVTTEVLSTKKLGDETTTVGRRMKTCEANPTMSETTTMIVGQGWKSFPSKRTIEHYKYVQQQNAYSFHCLSTRQINTWRRLFVKNRIIASVIEPSATQTTRTRSRRRYISTASSPATSISVKADTTSNLEKKIIVATRRWLENIVVGHKLCPFAVPLVKQPNTHKIRIVYCPHSIPDKNCLRFVRREVEYLLEPPNKDRDNNTDTGNETEEEGGGDEIGTTNTNNTPDDNLHHETTLIVFDYDDDDDGSDDDNENHKDCSSSTVNNVKGSKATATAAAAAAAATGTFLGNHTINRYMDFVRFSWELQEYAILGHGTMSKLGSIDNGHNYEGDNDNGDGIAMKSYQDDVQIVLFHPNATHQTYGQHVSMDIGGGGGGDNDNDDEEDLNHDAGDYTIRSPYPTVHLLREQDVLSAVKSGYPGLEYLPSRNQAKMTSLGRSACKKQLEACKK